MNIFSTSSPYKKRARILALGWTLLIFIACFIPGKDIPDVQVAFIDKYAHFILFGGFTFLWLCGYPGKGIGLCLLIFLLSVLLGWLVEFLQGQLTMLGRDQDNMDIVADAVGGAAGLTIFLLSSRLAARKK